MECTVYEQQIRWMDGWMGERTDKQKKIKNKYMKHPGTGDRSQDYH